MLRSIFTKSLRDQRRGIAAWSFGIGVIGLLYAVFWPMMDNPDMARAVESFPKEFLEAMGWTDFLSPAGYLGTPVYKPGTNDPTFGFPRRGGQPRLNIPMKGLLDGGTETEYFDVICAGDVLEETSHLADLRLRETGMSKNTLFVTNESVYKNKATGKVVAKQKLTSIHY